MQKTGGYTPAQTVAIVIVAAFALFGLAPLYMQRAGPPKPDPSKLSDPPLVWWTVTRRTSPALTGSQGVAHPPKLSFAAASMSPPRFADVVLL